MGCGSSKVLRPPEILPASRQRDDDRVLVGIGGGGTGANATAAAIVTLPVGRSTGLSLAVNTADHDHPPGDPVAGDPFKAALRLLPFLPRRISTLHDCLLISGRGVPPLSVVPLRAALLLLDVSGFTRLSEAYGRSGTAGCEKFSLVMSDFFRRLTVILEQYGGDIDCFAGDAVLVVFQERAGSGKKTGNTLADAVRQALECARAVVRSLPGFRASPGDTPLQIHAGLSAGELHSVICSGVVVSRSQWFVIGGALQELGPALSLSKSSELALAPSAKGILASTTNLGGEERGEGYLCIPLLSADGPEDLAASSAADSDVSDKIGSLTTISELARRLLAAQQEDDGGMRKLGSIGGLNLLAGHHNLFQGDGDDAARPAIANLMRFTLPFVSARLKQTIMNADLLLSEHRQISVLFITGGVQDHGCYSNVHWIEGLKSRLGKAIDTAEVECGGATRQITVDDKGVVAIFLFGLPGNSSVGRHPVSCALAAHEVLESLEFAGIRFCAGLSTGSVFCGLVGDVDVRCEYAVMGDVVNTAARLARFAHNHGHRVICAESYKDELAALGETSSVHLQHAGSAKLKGKRDEIAVYSVHPATTKPAQLKSSMEFQHAPLHGRSGAIEDLMTSLGSLAVSKGGLVLVNATVGLGKSALMQAIAAKLEDEAFPEYEFLRGAECALFEALPVRGMPMHICHCVLEWILEAGGHQSAWELCVLEELSLEALQEAACPATLRPHLQRLARLKQGQPHGRDRKPDMWHYQEMYASIMLDELTTRPVVLIVDNFHLLDVASIGVFSHLLSLASRQQQDETPHRYPLLLLGTANISSLSALDEVHSTSSAKALETLQRLPNVTTYTLSPLSNGAVEDMIKLDLGCDNLSRELVSVVTDFAQGNPLYVHEFTRWLKDQGRLKVETVDTKKSVDVRRSTCSMHQDITRILRITQMQLDQQDIGHVAILQCASCIGLVFEEGLLFELLTSIGLTTTKTLLAKQLQALQQNGILSRNCGSATNSVVRSSRSFTSGRNFDVASWKFCKPLCKSAVHQLMLHKTRYMIHCKLELILESRMERIEDSSNPAYRQTAKLLVLQALVEQQTERAKLRVAPLTIHELRNMALNLDQLCSITIEEAGRMELCLQYEDQLLAIVNSELAASSKPAQREVLQLQLKVVVKAMHNMARIVMFGNSLVCPEEVASRMDKLEGMISKIREAQQSIDSSGPRKLPQRDKTIQKTNHQITDQLMTVAKLSRLLIEWVMSDEMLREDSLNTALEMLEAQTTMSGRLIIVNCTCCFTASLTQINRAFGQIKEYYSTFLDAGRPKELLGIKTAVGTFAAATLSACKLVMGNMLGNIDSEAHVGDFNLDLSGLAMAKEHLGLEAAVGFAQLFELAWEPAGSMRHQRLRHLVQSGVVHPRKRKNNLWPRFLEHQAELCRVGQQAEALAKRLASPGVTEDQHELKKDLQDWRESVSAVGSICLRMPIKFWIWAVVRFLVSSGCQLIWPDVWTATPGRPLLEAVNCSPMRKSPRLAAEQLSAVATSLSELIGWWEDHRINIRGHSCAPAGLVYAKAMLQWFQWLLQQTGHRSEDPIDARMKHTVRGWAPAARSRPGGHSISQALLLSQAMASGPTDEETSELMVAMLPATVALAMLLAGAGLPSNAADNAMLGPQHLGPVKSFSIGSSLLVPVKLPGFRDGAEDEPASEDAVPVEWVQVGRRRALEVGKGHLEGVLKRIRLGDAPLNLAACKDVDVGYSAIIWQAVGLYQTIQNYLDGM